VEARVLLLLLLLLLMMILVATTDNALLEGPLGLLLMLLRC
jgi:hypothetical protein